MLHVDGVWPYSYLLLLGRCILRIALTRSFNGNLGLDQTMSEWLPSESIQEHAPCWHLIDYTDSLVINIIHRSDRHL